MDNIAELERRITAALMRIDGGINTLAGLASGVSPRASEPGPVATLADGVAEAEIARLNEALDEERMANAQLNERLRALRQKEAALIEAAAAALEEAQAAAAGFSAAEQGSGSGNEAALEAEVARLSKLLDVQGLEMARLKKTVVSLREQLRLMAEAQAEGRIEPHLINRAMLTELEALRAQRSAETAELEELIAALDPLAGPKTEGEINA